MAETRRMISYVSDQSKNDVLLLAEQNKLDTEFLRFIEKNEEAFRSFHQLYMQLKGPLDKRIHIINEAVAYVRRRKKDL